MILYLEIYTYLILDLAGKMLPFYIFGQLIHEAGHALWSWKNSVPIAGIRIFSRGPCLRITKFKIPIIVHVFPLGSEIHCGDMSKSSPIEYQKCKRIALAGPIVDLSVATLTFITAYTLYSIDPHYKNLSVFQNEWLLYGVISLIAGGTNLCPWLKGSDGWFARRANQQKMDDIIHFSYRKFIEDLQRIRM